jgi:hypothetical protein
MKQSIDQRRGAIRLVAPCVLLIFLLATARPALAQEPTHIIFLHHSCGHNLIEQGDVREGLTQLGYAFYDHGYNGDGLRLADGSYTGTNFDVPGDNTDPDGIAAIFAQPLHDPPDNTFSHLMQYDVIAFKSCFPTSNIGSEEQLEAYRSHYRSVRDRMDQHPERIFIVVTQPPQVPGASNAEEARRARALADWLASDEFLGGHPNVFTFDFFGHLAGSENFLRPEYRFDDYDGHPNQRANREIGPEFVAFIDQAIRSYEPSEPRPTPTDEQAATPPTPTATAAAEQTEERPAPTAPPSTGGLQMIDDFESEGGQWWADADEKGSTVECGPHSGRAHGGTGALRIAYDVAPDGWVDCGRSFQPPQDWSAGKGISLWIYVDGAAEWVTLMVFSGDPDDPTPFEADLWVDGVHPLSSESVGGWTQLGLSWASFERAEWAAGGPSAVDPTRMIGYAFSLGGEEGELWMDDVHLSVGAAPPLVAPTAEQATPEATDEALGGEAEEESVEEGVEPDQPLGGICPGAALALPLVALGLLITGRKRERPQRGGITDEPT